MKEQFFRSENNRIIFFTFSIAILISSCVFILIMRNSISLYRAETEEIRKILQLKEAIENNKKIKKLQFLIDQKNQELEKNKNLIKEKTDKKNIDKYHTLNKNNELIELN